MPDVVTDQTSAHDPMYGYIPVGMTVAEAASLRESDPDAYLQKATGLNDDSCAGDARLAG